MKNLSYPVICPKDDGVKVLGGEHDHKEQEDANPEVLVPLPEPESQPLPLPLPMELWRQFKGLGIGNDIKRGDQEVIPDMEITFTDSKFDK